MSEEKKREPDKQKPKLQHKSSFLDRMRRKRLIAKREEQISQSSNNLDICDSDAQSEYNYPPPPRPIYVKPPTLRDSCDSEQVYDDINVFRKSNHEGTINGNYGK